MGRKGLYKLLHYGLVPPLIMIDWAINTNVPLSLSKNVLTLLSEHTNVTRQTFTDGKSFSD